jgi:hypothetical protein
MERSMCEMVNELILAWERTGALSSADLTLLSEHLEQCRRCWSAYVALMPLLRRDAGGSSGLRTAPGLLSESFTKRLMGKLAGGSPFRVVLGAIRRGIVPRLRLVLAVVAILLVVGGILSWFRGIQLGREDTLVRFELVVPEAHSVALVGDFCNWDPNQLVMKDATGEGNWQITIRLKKGQVYTYNYLMNGRQWIADPNSLRQVDDGFGGKSSVLEL